MPIAQGPPVRLERFLWEALELVDCPYLWGGKSREGIDCSGVVTYALWQAGGPDWRQTHASSTLLEVLQPVSDLVPGDIVCYRRHVMVHVASGIVVGACDGDSKTTTLAIAKERGARVKLKQRYDYRNDIVGLRRIPFIVDRGDLHHGIVK